MWIFTSTGFISIVEDKDDSTVVLVRARKREHLEAFLSESDRKGILETPGADYPVRIFMDKEAFVRKVAAAASRIDYPNFKAAIQDPDFHEFAMNTWAAGRDFQEDVAANQPFDVDKNPLGTIDK
jgi:hypothetical protein